VGSVVSSNSSDTTQPTASIIRLIVGLGHKSC
jgi:hypothetical protein